MNYNQSFDMVSLQNAYAAGQITPEAVIDECYRRIQRVGDDGIFLHLIDQQSAIGEAKNLRPFNAVNKALWGIPFAIKDNIDAAGTPTTAGCPGFAYEASEDAVVVKRLRDAGAILIGKTNLDQFAAGLVGLRTPYAVPKNALDPEIIPGGSSSGSALAVAHGMVTFALGTDTAGSGRVPAALNSIVGLKPSLGAISNTGVVPACRTLDTVSVFAMTVEDAYTVFQVSACVDEHDAYSRAIPAPPLGLSPPELIIGVPHGSSREFYGDQLQAGSFDRTLNEIAHMGGKIVEIDFSTFYDIAQLLYDGAWLAERYAVIEPMLKNQADEIYPLTRQIIAAAENLSAVAAFRDFYRLQELKKRGFKALEGIDMLCVPSIPTYFTVADVEADALGPNSKLGTYTNFVNLMDMCGITVPVSPREDGRPGSVTLLAVAGRDVQIAGFASALQQQCKAPMGATAWRLPAMRTKARQPATDEIALVVAGAHMSGLALNKELTRLGGRYLYSSRTKDSYRLYKLAGGPPYRPGLVCADTGEAIQIEVWALPIKAFGEFMQGIPSPLGIGTVMLENGEQVKGFICEQRGLKDAVDITSFEGWRAYLESLPAS